MPKAKEQTSQGGVMLGFLTCYARHDTRQVALSLSLSLSSRPIIGSRGQGMRDLWNLFKSATVCVTYLYDIPLKLGAKRSNGNYGGASRYTPSKSSLRGEARLRPRFLRQKES